MIGRALTGRPSPCVSVGRALPFQYLCRTPPYHMTAITAPPRDRPFCFFLCRALVSVSSPPLLVECIAPSSGARHRPLRRALNWSPSSGGQGPVSTQALAAAGFNHGTILAGYSALSSCEALRCVSHGPVSSPCDTQVSLRGLDLHSERGQPSAASDALDLHHDILSAGRQPTAAHVRIPGGA